MYDELILKLREDAEFLEISSKYNNTKNEFAERISQAADAIEELNRRIDRAIELYNRNVEKSAMYEAFAGISPEPPKEETCTKN